MGHEKPLRSICAVIVTYQPDLPNLRRLIDVCLPQVACIVVVDNGSDSDSLKEMRGWEASIHLDLIEIGENLGVAAAQNRGILWARTRACSHVVLFDQDSIPATNMIALLLSAHDQLSASGFHWVVMGPRIVDSRLGTSVPFVSVGLFGVKRIRCDDTISNVIATDFLVSSGTLIPMNAFEKVGLLEEGLFVDNVDMEWCFRARSLGVSIFGVCRAQMEHSVGDRVVKLGKYIVYCHSPLRQYYMMRNRILLYRRSYSPWGWVVQDFFRLLLKLLLFSLIFRPRCENIRMMTLGVLHGFQGKKGKFLC